MNRKDTECKACKAPIKFIKLAIDGTWIPLDVDPVGVRKKAGGNSYILPDGRMVFGEQVGDACDEPGILSAYISHFATCPYAGRFRKPRKRDRKLIEQEKAGSANDTQRI